MINLLPPDVKQNIIYARLNTRLRKWMVAIFGSIVVIVVIVAVGNMYMQQSIRSYEKQIDAGSQALKAQQLEETQKKVQTITDNLKLVVQVLQREVLFSKLLSQIGAALPGGSILTNLSINTVEGGLDLQVGASDYQTATQVQLNLQDKKNKIFEKADIINIQCASTDPAKSKYPCNVQIRALFAKDNSFSFMGTSQTKGAKP